MTPTTCSCQDSDLLLAAHRALPLPGLLRVQLHRLVCPVCRERYRQFCTVSRELAAAMGPGKSSSLPVWGAALLCFCAFTVALWSAHYYLAQPDFSACEPASASASVDSQAATEHCADPEIAFKKRAAK